jgi:hypothetical protein
MPTLTAATVPVSGRASDLTVCRTVEALAADAPAALKAIGTTAQRGLGLWCRVARWVSRGSRWFRG